MKSGLLSAAVLLLAFAIACGATSPAPLVQPVAPATAPDIAPVASSPPPAAPRPLATAVTLTDAEKAALQEFAARHDRINGEWDEAHSAFDKWRSGLTECSANARLVGLRQFSSDAFAIQALVRSLPRQESTRRLADSVIEAAESEEAAFRSLRDGWTPADTALFEAVDEQISNAERVQNQLKDDLIDLKGRASNESRVLVLAFSLELDKVNAGWDKFHEDYNEFRTGDGALATSATAISRQVEAFSLITSSIRKLPHDPVTAPITDILLEAAQAEELALRNLRNPPDSGNGSPPPRPFEEPAFPLDPNDASEEPGNGAPNGDQNGAAENGSEVGSFRDFGAHIVRSDSVRRRAAESIGDLLIETSEDNRRAVDAFETEYQALGTEWAGLHENYKEWRSSQGGCDTTKAAQSLSQFSIDFSKVVNDIRNLSTTPLLRPIGELFVQAAEREQVALRSLQSEWRPFDATVYEGIDKERRTGSKLRRQVAAGLSNLLAEYSLRGP
ncbi:MAG: hypothetical protein IH861_09475 [Chloroflexi bacterium]|nr:hypothetical protein [Chloroflexota bacterium]